MRAPRLLLFLASFSLAAAVRADEPSVTAVLSNSETSVGQPVELEIQVTGASNPRPPAQITVDGLEIQSMGTSRQYQIQNFSINYSFTFSYMVTPLRAGRLVIPPQPIDVGGDTLETPELTLNVSAGASGGARSAQPNRRSGALDGREIGFMEMLIPETTAYVGEVVPVQIRVAIGMQTPVQSRQTDVQIAGQGFTTMRTTEPRQSIETINGRSYQVFIYKTAVAAARTGKLEIGPAEMNPVVRIPRPGTRNPFRQRGGPFDDPFFNNFFNDPAFAPSVAREVHLESEQATLEVKPLPPNAPSQFAGAVGNFSLKVEASPKKVNVGDPITIRATVTGRGNFDRVNAPVLANDQGWHQYPATDNFRQDDDVGISGAKTFEIVVSPKEKKDELPPLIFSYFDPAKETYVTLQSDPIAIAVEGAAAPAPQAAPTSAPAASPQTSPPPASSPTPAQPVDDILPQLDERTAAEASFAPLYTRRPFWLAQLVLLVTFIAFLAWRWHGRRANNRELKRQAELQREAAAAERALRRSDASAHEYLAQAARTVQLKTAVARKTNPHVVDAEIAAATFGLDEHGRARLRRLFERRDEVRYSGSTNGHSEVSPEERREIQELVEGLRT